MTSPDLNAADAVPVAGGRRRRWRPYALPGLVLVLLAVLGVWHVLLALRIRGELQALRMEPADWAPAVMQPAAIPPQVPNGAALVEQAFKLFPISATTSADDLGMIFFEAQGFPPPDETFSPEYRREMDRILTVHAEAMGLIRRGLEADHFIYSRDYQYGYNTPFSQIPDIRRGVGLFCLQAVVCSEDGDLDGAVQAIRTAIRLGESMRADRSGVAFAARLSVRPFPMVTIWWLVNRCHLTPDQLLLLVDSLRMLEDDRAIADAYQVEFASGMLTLDRVRRGDASSLTDLAGIAMSPSQNWRMRVLGLDKLETLRFVRAMGEMEEAVHLPLPDRRTTCRAVNALYADLPEPGLARSLVFEGGLYAYFESEHLARSRSTMAILQTLAGGQPSAEALPLDPFTGEPIHVLCHANGMLAYSVGRNGVDDGGDGFGMAGRGDTGMPLDIVVSVGDPPPNRLNPLKQTVTAHD